MPWYERTPAPLFFSSKTLKTRGGRRTAGTDSFDLEDATQVSGSDASKDVGQDARQDARQDAIRKVGRAVSSEKGRQKEGPESGG